MKKPAVVLSLTFAVLLCAAFAAPCYGIGREFLTSQEIDKIQDEQDFGKRVLLYLEFAKRRIDEVKQNAASKEADAGDTIQDRLEEYTAILDALHESLEHGREQRTVLNKTIKVLQTQGADFLKFLESLDSGTAANKEDYQLTLKEAIDTTEDELAEAKKGVFPEVKDRTPPSDLPAKPPRASPPPRDPPPSSSQPSSEEGPPRKKSRSSSQNQ